MKIIFLGTAAAEGWPALFCECDYCKAAKKLGGKNIRRRSATLIDNNILVDFGPDIYSFMLDYDISLTELDALLITHSHSDHFDLVELMLSKVPYAHFSPGSGLDVYGNDIIKSKLDSALTKDSLIQSVKAQPFSPFNVNGYDIHPLLASHGDEIEDCLIYAIEKDGKAFLLGNDTNYFPEATWEYIKKLKFDGVALDTTFGTLKSGPKGTPGHMGIECVNETKNRMIEIGCADEQTQFYMHHFSHNGKLLHHELEDAGRPFDLKPTYDGLSINL